MLLNNALLHSGIIRIFFRLHYLSDTITTAKRCRNMFLLKVITHFVTSSVFLKHGFRVQYSLDIADRLADEHILIGLYVNLLRKDRSWSVWAVGLSEVAVAVFFLICFYSLGHHVNLVIRRIQYNIVNAKLSYEETMRVFPHFKCS